MQFKISLLIVRDKRQNNVLAVYPIEDYDTNIQVIFEPEWIESVDDIKDSLKNWGTSTLNWVIERYMEGKCFSIEDDAKHIPSIGNALVRIEQHIIDII